MPDCLFGGGKKIVWHTRLGLGDETDSDYDLESDLALLTPCLMGDLTSANTLSRG